MNLVMIDTDDKGFRMITTYCRVIKIILMEDNKQAGSTGYISIISEGSEPRMHVLTAENAQAVKNFSYGHHTTHH